MDTQVANGTLTIEKIGTGRRISEILYDQNSTPRAFCERVSFAKKDTVRACLNDTRYISPKELQEMADLLGYSVDRILQKDTEKSALTLRVAVRSKTPGVDAIDLGKKLLKAALGWTEKCDYLNDLGSAYYYQDRIDEAHECYLDAFKYAKKINEKFYDRERLYMVTSNLTITYTRKKDYMALDNLLHEVEPAFELSDPESAGTIAYSRAVIATNRGDYDLAFQKWTESLRQYEKTENTDLIGRGYHNLAFFFFKFGKYDEARELFARSISSLAPNSRSLHVAIVNCTKNLIKLGEIANAKKMIESVLSSELKNEIRARLHILYAIATNNPFEAQKALSLEGITDNTKLCATFLLMDACAAQGDSEGLMRYYINVGNIPKTKLPSWEEL